MKIILSLLAVIFISVNCNWADRKIKEKKQRQTFHKRILWQESKVKNCPTEYYIEKFRRRPQSHFVNVLATASRCTLFFQFLQTENEENEITYVLNLAIITSASETIFFEDTVKLKFSDIGWGYRIEWKFISSNQPYSFKLYMRPGVYEDPFLPKD